MARRNVISEIRGDKEIANILENIVPKESRNLMRSTMDGIAAEIKKKAAANARNRGLQTISKAIKSKRKKSPPDKPVSVVVVEKGGGVKNDGWKWAFFEFGTGERVIKSGPFAGRNVGRIRETPFIRPAKDAIFAKLPQIIREQFQKKLAARIKRIKKQISEGKLVPK